MTGEETSATPNHPSRSPSWYEARIRCAYHEAGHAVAAHLLGRSLAEVSIMPSFGRCFGGRLFGYCKYVPLPNANINIKEEIMLCFAGEVAEVVICDQHGWTHRGWRNGWYDDDA